MWHPNVFQKRHMPDVPLNCFEHHFIQHLNKNGSNVLIKDDGIFRKTRPDFVTGPATIICLIEPSSSHKIWLLDVDVT